MSLKGHAWLLMGDGVGDKAMGGKRKKSVDMGKKRRPETYCELSIVPILARGRAVKGELL